MWRFILTGEKVIMAFSKTGEPYLLAFLCMKSYSSHMKSLVNLELIK